MIFIEKCELCFPIEGTSNLMNRNVCKDKQKQHLTFHSLVSNGIFRFLTCPFDHYHHTNLNMVYQLV